MEEVRLQSCARLVCNIRSGEVDKDINMWILKLVTVVERFIREESSVLLVGKESMVNATEISKCWLSN